jgi:hypothetical protein
MLAVPEASHAMDDPVRRLEEMRDALDQAAIVTATDHRG